MTILELIQKACKTKGVPEKYAERIQKTFKIEKAEGMEACVDLFKDNILPAITESEEAAKTAAQTAAVSEYEKKHGLKDGKPVENTDDGKNKNPLLDGLSPELKAFIEQTTKKMEEMEKRVETSTKSAANAEKMATAKTLLSDAKLPVGWISRINPDSETSLQDQVKALTDEYTAIQQDIIGKAVENGDYAPGGGAALTDRSEEDWAKLMDGDSKASNPGVVDLGI